MIVDTEQLSVINGIVAVITRLFPDKGVPTEVVKQFNASYPGITFAIRSKDGQRILVAMNGRDENKSIHINLGFDPGPVQPTTTPSGDADGFLKVAKVA